MKPFSCEPWAALAVLFLTTALWDSCSAAAEDISNVSTTEYEPPCLNVNFCRQAATCCPSGMDDYGWIAAAVGWSLWFLTLILLCMDKIIKLRPDEPKYLVAWRAARRRQTDKAFQTLAKKQKRMEKHLQPKKARSKQGSC